MRISRNERFQALSLALAACFGATHAFGAPLQSSAAACGSPGGLKASPSGVPAAINPAIQNWSDPDTWGGSAPSTGANVVIPVGKSVILDLSPPPLRSLRIEGSLIFQDRDISLAAKTIEVRGLLQVGTAAKPFLHHATFTLTGGKFLTGHSDPSTKAILVVGGRLELHGKPCSCAWTHLDCTASAGTNRLMLDRPVGWRPGERIVIAPTDFNPLQADSPVIAAVRGRQITLRTRLQWSHWGQVSSGVDERAEVGLLTHNVVIQGDASSARHGIGGQVMMMGGGQAHIEGVELCRMGRRGQLGRYPIHFHLLGDATGCYVKESSIHHCYNRCITIHGTRSVLLDSNVCFDTIGHCYFLEDGAETGNVLVNNLGVLTRKAHKAEAVLPSDLTPATFWVTNPDNVLRGNAAAGSEGDGFWYDLPRHPTGACRSVENDRLIWPRRTPLGEFCGNVAHSNDFNGLYVDNERNAIGDMDAPNYEPHCTTVPPLGGKEDSAPCLSVFDGLTAYKNRRRAAWLRGNNLQLQHANLADNSIAVTFASSNAELSNSLVVGETANTGNPAPGETTGLNGRSLPKPFEPGFPIRGFEFYDGPVGARNVTFANFVPDQQRGASALGYTRFTPFFVDPGNYVEGARFVNANRVLLDRKPDPPCAAASADGYRSALFVDRDGSVTGTAGQFVVFNNPFLLDKSCTLHRQWNAATSSAPYGRLFIDNRDARPRASAPVDVSLPENGKVLQRLWGSPGSLPTVDFETTVIANRGYRVAFHGSVPDQLRLTFWYRQPGDWIEIALPCKLRPASVYTGDNPDARLKPAVNRAAYEASNGQSYLLAGGEITFRLAIPVGQAEAVVNVCLSGAGL